MAADQRTGITIRSLDVGRTSLGASAQGLKQQALKLLPGSKLKGGWARKAASRKLTCRGPWIKFRGARIGRLD